MNIICNDCVGGRLYQHLNKEYNNPFIWCRIYYNSFRKILCNFNNIDFYNIKYDDSYFTDGIKTHIILENDIEINYPHYIQNSKFSIPTKQNNNIDIYYNDIKTYTVNKYLSRLNRMNMADFKIFILNDKPQIHLSKDDILDFLNLKVDGVKILITNDDKYKNYNDTNVLITNETNTSKIAYELLMQYSNIFN